MNIKKLTMAGILSLSALTAATPMVQASEVAPHSVAEEQTLNVEVGIDKTLEVPLTINAEHDIFYNCTNFGPGDTLKAKIIFKNTSTEDIQVAVVDVVNQLTDDAKAVALLDELELQLSVDGELNYKGIHSKVTSPVTNWITVKPGEELPMDIVINMPKTADNKFQNANMLVKWVFQTRADVPPDPVEEDEETQTGDEGIQNYGKYLLGAAGVVVVAGVGVMAISKKKKKEDSKK